MFKRLFLTLFISTQVFAASQQGMKINDYPPAATAGDKDLFLLDYWNGTRYSTNKSFSFTNFVSQVIPLLNNVAGKLTISSNLSDVASSSISRSNLVAETRRVFNVRDYGAVGDGVTDDTTAVVAAYNAISTNYGGTIYFPSDGQWKYNLVILKPNITIQGGTHYVDGYSGTTQLISRHIPANITQPVIQIGNDTGYVRGIHIRDCTFYGGNTASMGIYFAGGAFECKIENSTVSFFNTCIKAQGGTTYPCSIIYFNNVIGQPRNIDNARGFYFSNPSNYPTSYTTELVLNNCHWNGPASGTNSFLMEIESCEVKLVNTYFDVSDGHGIKLSHNLTPFPWLDGLNSNLDSGLNTRVAIEGYSTNRLFSGLAGINYQINGKYKESDGFLMQPAPGVLRQNTLAVYPTVYGALSFANPSDTNWVGGTFNANRIYGGGGPSQATPPVLYFDTQGQIRTLLGNGVFGLENSQNFGPDGNIYFQFHDLLNSKDVTIHTLSGFLDFRPDTGAAVRIQNKSGSLNTLFINEDGRIYLQRTGTNSPFVYLDNNSQVKPGTTGAGITNATAGTLSVNLAAGSNVTFTTNSNGQISIASSGGGGGLTGTMISDVTGFSTGAVPKSKDSTGTNFTGSGVIITSTNVSIPGTLTVDNIVATNGIVIGGGSTNLNITGNIFANGGVFTNTLTLGGQNVVTANRTLTAGTGLSGGGDLSADRTFNVTTNSTQQKVWVFSGTTNLGTFGSITFWPGSNVTLSTTNGTGNTNIDIAISSTGGGGGGLGYVLKFGGTDTSFNPSSGGFTLYSGGSIFSVPSTSFTNQCVIVPKAGTIKTITVRVRDDGTLGSSENVTFKISINGAAGSGTGVIMPISAINNLGTSSSESIAVTAGQAIALTFTTPTWATPPTSCYIESWVYIE